MFDSYRYTGPKLSFLEEDFDEVIDRKNDIIRKLKLKIKELQEENSNLKLKLGNNS